MSTQDIAGKRKH